MISMNRRQVGLLAVLAQIAFGASLGRAAQAYDVIVESGVAAKMRDGIVLHADIYRPRQDGRYPVLLQRTPYNKDNDWGAIPFAFKAAAAGYVVIIQDVRGRYSSEGEWYPFKNESSDGYDTVEWAASLPYANGQVGMFGGSYVGATQMLAAIARPPHLAGINPSVTASNYHDGWTYQGGAFEQWFSESWAAGLAQDTLNRAIVKNTNAMLGAQALPLATFPLFNSFALAGGADLSPALAPYFLDWLAHPGYDDYWKQWSIEDHYAELTVPALTIAAWYDIFQGGSLRNYVGLQAHGASQEARTGQRLIVEIGGHAGSGRKIGDVDFGPAAALDDSELTLEWYDYLFKGVQNQFAKTKPVRIFVMGANQWRDEDEWPLKRAQNARFYLHSRGSANSSQGNGTLSRLPPDAEPSDQYRYDPSHPVPTVGGPLCCDGAHLQPGPRDQRLVESRPDVLIYSTAPLADDVEVTGPISVELYAESSSVDTDFTAKLVDVDGEGFAQNLTEGIIRARYRNSQEKAELLKPGQVYKFTIDLWSTSNVFRRGHTLRLEISSSNFPRFDRNLNTGEGAESGTQSVSAINTIYHDSQHRSLLVLPIVPRGAAGGD
jgi:hypothetical protein